MRYAILVLLIFIPTYFLAQENLNLNQWFADYDQRAELSNIPQTLKILSEENSLVVIDWVSDSINNSSQPKEYFLYGTLLTFAYSSEFTSVRKKAANKFLASLYAKPKSDYFLLYSRKSLLIKPECYNTPETHDIMLSVLKNENLVTYHHILLCAALKIEGCEEVIRNKYLLKNEKRPKWDYSEHYFKQFRWASLLALGRLGGEKESKQVIDTLRSFPHEEIAVQYLGDIAYLSNKQALIALKYYLYSDETFDHEELNVAKYVIKIIKEIAVFLPIDTTYLLSEGDIRKLRKWVENNEIYFKSDFIYTRRFL